MTTLNTNRIWHKALAIMFPDDASDEVVWFEYHGLCTWATPWNVSLDHWQLFGLAVEWLKAQGWHVKYWPVNDGHDYQFRPVKPIGLDQYEFDDSLDVIAPDLPTAIARWIVKRFDVHAASEVV